MLYRLQINVIMSKNYHYRNMRVFTLYFTLFVYLYIISHYICTGDDGSALVI